MHPVCVNEMLPLALIIALHYLYLVYIYAECVPHVYAESWPISSVHAILAKILSANFSPSENFATFSWVTRAIGKIETFVVINSASHWQNFLMRKFPRMQYMQGRWRAKPDGECVPTSRH